MRRVALVLLFVVAALAAPALASARPPATYTWCGTDETQQNRVPDLEVSSAQQVRVVYAVPSDGVDDFQASANGIVNDAAWIDQWWQAQDPTRTPRFDRYPFPGCTSTWGQLDIGFIRLPRSSASYASPDSPSIVLDEDLARAFPPTQKTIVYYDGPTGNSQICGETDYRANMLGGDNGIVYIFPQSECRLTPLGSGSSAEVAAHELLHNLGAVPDSAPHVCAAPNGAHACDSTTDIMDPYLSPGSTLDNVVLDFNRDDYYAHNGSWWDVQDSSWLEHLPQFPVSLAVQGSGTLSARAGTVQLPCTNGCSSLAVDNATSVSVIAVPAAGWMFSGWSGACSGTVPSCIASVGAATNVTATFVPLRVRVRVGVTGRGRITSTPTGISCPGTCSASFAGSARLAAKPAPGWTFAGWTGACRGRKSCPITVTAAAHARFVRR